MSHYKELSASRAISLVHKRDRCISVLCLPELIREVDSMRARTMTPRKRAELVQKYRAIEAQQRASTPQQESSTRRAQARINDYLMTALWRTRKYREVAT